MSRAIGTKSLSMGNVARAWRVRQGIPFACGIRYWVRSDVGSMPVGEVGGCQNPREGDRRLEAI